MPAKESAPSSKATNKRASAAGGSRAGAASKRRAVATPTRSISEDARDPQSEQVEDDEDEEDEEQQKTIPPALLTRLLHEFFTKEGTRVTKDANAAVARYMDVFVREAIARSVAEREGGGFLEVEDLEKVAPQLLLDM
ncbi:hypothetical protein BR93DRAFT_968376 [Coniochaeta sp. PMI_546]|nr:hypothetical protein BR93DRAFT_968376 [Coniochaeta sp. PMI_546]